MPINSPTKTLHLWVSHEHSCPYLDGRRARDLIVDATFPMTDAVYGELLEKGFRRSGSTYYRPNCPQCQSCVPVRVPVDDFRGTRRQKRIWKRNDHLRVRAQTPAYSEHHYDLYLKYLRHRHTDGTMQDQSRSAYMNFLCDTRLTTVFNEFYDESDLVMVAVTDVSLAGLSAVYTFYDPSKEKFSLGVFAILWQIRFAQQLGRKYLYLGYWISECRKMCYKSDYRPLEKLTGDVWQHLLDDEHQTTAAR